jgi:hypothetical protein
MFFECGKAPEPSGVPGIYIECRGQSIGRPSSGSPSRGGKGERSGALTFGSWEWMGEMAWGHTESQIVSSARESADPNQRKKTG